ncbi:ATP-binding protein [Halostreptopolyspora alba]|uniref:ATP-binding protein n=1 Tax=Halostreptopolyspora alba TaxID=2487137 RepID=A0A3N0EGN6_9ACTN|nr:ATP-binding protein [Nocardiopsaceae bacterium YIM 96095]
MIASLTEAVEAAPTDLTLRLHLAELLLNNGDHERAISHIATALQHDAHSTRAQQLMARALGNEVTADSPSPAPPPDSTETSNAPAPRSADPPPPPTEAADALPLDTADFPLTSARVTIADVAGMQAVKDRMEAAFLAPMRNAQLRQAFSKSLRGGLLMYGPPGCGKTFLAQALSGEMGAHFLSISLADILDRWLGNSERNVQALFRQARQYRPCVLFVDELDAIGGRRARVTSGMRPVVTQLLTELDSIEDDNEGVFVLAATNHPWDVDTALRRPGRLDRALFVPPPDEEARAAILRAGIRDRPTREVDIAWLAGATDGFSGADLTHLCESAAERALLDSARQGQVRPITPEDFRAALREVRPSTGPWFETARNVVSFAGGDDTYDDLAAYLRGRGRFRRK